ncbi:PucR family transcriptional regulator ligand-binding domain-containing protein [Streptomyces parvus]
MHVEDLLRLESLGLTLLWGDRPQLTREISGVTATDLEDPGRFLQRGELVLSGLVWWAPADDEAKAERFVAALEEAGAVALLAGEETHGACRRCSSRRAGDTASRFSRCRCTGRSGPSPTRCTYGSGAT